MFLSPGWPYGTPCWRFVFRYLPPRWAEIRDDARAWAGCSWTFRQSALLATPAVRCRISWASQAARGCPVPPRIVEPRQTITTVTEVVFLAAHPFSFTGEG